MTEKELYRANQTFRAIIPLLEKHGQLTNLSAKRFVECTTKYLPHIGVIAEIAKKLEQCSNLTPEEIQILREICTKYHILDESTSKIAPSNSNELFPNMPNSLQLTSEIRLIDLTNCEHTLREQYSYVFGDFIPCRQYILVCNKDVNKTSITYINYLFSNDVDQIQSDTLETLLSRDNIVSCIMRGFGLLSIQKEKCFSNAIKEQVFLRLLREKHQSLIRLHRSDGSIVSFLRIGKILVSSGESVASEKLDQYLIWSTGKFLTTMFLSYGNIDIARLETSHKYGYSVSNLLLSEKNLNNSRYIGSILGDNYIHKNHLICGPCIRTNEMPSDIIFRFIV